MTAFAAGISFYLLFKLSSEIQAGSSLFPSVIAGFLFTQTSCLIFLYHRHVVQMVRTLNTCIMFVVRTAITHITAFNRVVVGSNPTVPIQHSGV